MTVSATLPLVTTEDGREKGAQWGKQRAHKFRADQLTILLAKLTQ